MFKLIHQLFDQLNHSASADSGSIDESLAIAALLIEVASADGQFDAAEQQALAQLLEKQFHCPAATLEALIDTAKHSQQEAVCLYRYTRVVKQSDMATRVKLIEGLWHIAYADGRLDPYEEASIRKVAELLYVSHSDFVRSKLTVLAEQSTTPN